MRVLAPLLTLPLVAGLGPRMPGGPRGAAATSLSMVLAAELARREKVGDKLAELRVPERIRLRPWRKPKGASFPLGEGVERHAPRS